MKKKQEMDYYDYNYAEPVKRRKSAKGLIIGLIIGLLVAVCAFLVMDYLTTDKKVTNIGFEDIGELSTQVAYCTVLDVIDDPRKIFDITIPFTNSKLIYSYDVVVKAGLDFEKIKWEKDDDNIIVYMPELYITNCYLDESSAKVYYEKESIFSPITFDEESNAKIELIEEGKKVATEKGLYDRAKENAESMIKSFFTTHDEFKDCKIVFEWQE